MGSSSSTLSFRFADSLREWNAAMTNAALVRYVRLHKEKADSTSHIFSATISRREFLDVVFLDASRAVDGVLVSLPPEMFREMDRGHKGRVKVIEVLLLLYLYGGGELDERLRAAYRLVNSVQDPTGASKYNVENILRYVCDAHYLLGIATRLPEDDEVSVVVSDLYDYIHQPHSAGVLVDDFVAWCTSPNAILQGLARFVLRRTKFESMMRTTTGQEALRKSIDFILPLKPGEGSGEEDGEEGGKGKKKRRTWKGKEIPKRTAAQEKRFREGQRKRAIERATSRDEVEHVLEHTALSTSQVALIRDKFVRYADRNGELNIKCFRLVMAEAMPAVAMDGSADRLFDAFDADRSGKINFREFCSGLAIVMDGPLMEKVDLLFSIYDADGDGEINIHELVRFVKNGSERIFTAAQRVLDKLAKMETAHEDCVTAREFGELVLSTPTLARSIIDEIGGQQARLERQARDQEMRRLELERKKEEAKDEEEAAAARARMLREGGKGVGAAAKEARKTISTRRGSVAEVEMEELEQAALEAEFERKKEEELRALVDRDASVYSTAAEAADALVSLLVALHQQQEGKKVGRKGSGEKEALTFARLWQLTCGHEYSDATHSRSSQSSDDMPVGFKIAPFKWLGSPLPLLGFDSEDSSIRATRMHRTLLALETICNVRILPDVARRRSSVTAADFKEATDPAARKASSASDASDMSSGSGGGGEGVGGGVGGADEELSIPKMKAQIPRVLNQLVELLLDKWPASMYATATGVADEWSAAVGASGELAGLGAPSAIVLKGARTLLDALARAMCRTPVEAALAFFRGVDIEGTGLVTKKELSKAILSLCTRTDGGLQAASRLIIALDVDGDSTISREEFRDAIRTKPELYDCFARLLEPQSLSTRQLDRLRRRAARIAQGESSAILYSVLGDTGGVGWGDEGGGKEKGGRGHGEEKDKAKVSTTSDLRGDVDVALGLSESRASEEAPRHSVISPIAGAAPSTAPSEGESDHVAPRDTVPVSSYPSATIQTIGGLEPPPARGRSDSEYHHRHTSSVAFGSIAGVSTGTEKKKARGSGLGHSRVLNPSHHRVQRADTMKAARSIEKDLERRSRKLGETLTKIHEAESRIRDRDRRLKLTARAKADAKAKLIKKEVAKRK